MRKTCLREHSMELFVVLAYLLSWGVEIPLALQYRGVLDSSLPYALHYLAAFGPLAAALLVSVAVEGSAGLKSLTSQWTQFRVNFRYWLAAASPLLIYLIAAVGLSFMQGTRINLAALGEVDFLPPLGAAVIPLWILTFGFGEETGWRGFALPRLQANHSALGASLRLWVIWAFWHLPLFFYSYQAAVIPGMLIGLLAGTIVFTWLYNSSRGSVLLTAVFHGLFNVTTACTSCQSGWSAALISTLVMAAALTAAIVYKGADLSSAGKRIYPPEMRSI